MNMIKVSNFITELETTKLPLQWCALALTHLGRVSRIREA